MVRTILYLLVGIAACSTTVAATGRKSFKSAATKVKTATQVTKNPLTPLPSTTTKSELRTADQLTRELKDYQNPKSPTSDDPKVLDAITNWKEKQKIAADKAKEYETLKQTK